jgi:hypothetical protein
MGLDAVAQERLYRVRSLALRVDSNVQLKAVEAHSRAIKVKARLQPHELHWHPAIQALDLYLGHVSALVFNPCNSHGCIKVVVFAHFNSP